MRLDKYARQAIARAIEGDIPAPDKSARRAKLQAQLVKHMSPECRKIYNRTPKALATHYVGDTVYDGRNWNDRNLILGDCPQKTLEALLAPYVEEDQRLAQTLRQLRTTIDACATLAALERTLPEFKKYFPTKAQPTKNLPAVANLVADLTKLGWPVSKSTATK